MNFRKKQRAVWKRAAINSKSCSHVFNPDKMLELEIHRKRLNYNGYLKCMPIGKSFIFMPFGIYAIWEVTMTSYMKFSLKMPDFKFKN